MIAKVGSTVKVRVFEDDGTRRNGGEHQDVQAVVISAGPPGVVADWARTTGHGSRWLLIRKSLSVPGQYDAVEGDRGLLGGES